MDIERRRAVRIDEQPPIPRLDWAYFFDIDGTLAEIAAHPGGARIERGIRELIERLHAATGGAVALITGRTIADADRLMDHASLPVAGQHGLERRDGDGRVQKHEMDEETFAEVSETVRSAIADKPGLVAELKGLSLALHYRGAPQLADYANELLQNARLRLGEEFSTMSGKMVVELKPSGMHKGVAISRFLSELNFNGRTPVFLGDDVTDEDGFSVINSACGHSIKVGGGPTSARWRLRTVADVREWLTTAFSDGAA